jgi:hypothetical protein
MLRRNGDCSVGLCLDVRLFSSDRGAKQYAILWPPSAFRIENGLLYAFTGRGRAYAIR